MPPYQGHPTEGTYTWLQVPIPPGLDAVTRLAAELGLHTELPSVIAEFRGHWVEYGVVEQRYAERNPQDFAMLVERYGHTAIKGKSYTTSAFLAHTLGNLSKYGAVLYHWGPATGRWHYNSQISWTYVPGETETQKFKHP